MGPVLKEAHSKGELLVLHVSVAVINVMITEASASGFPSQEEVTQEVPFLVFSWWLEIWELSPETASGWLGRGGWQQILWAPGLDSGPPHAGHLTQCRTCCTEGSPESPSQGPIAHPVSFSTNPRVAWQQRQP